MYYSDLRQNLHVVRPLSVNPCSGFWWINLAQVMILHWLKIIQAEKEGCGSKFVEVPGIDPGTSRMLSERSTI